MFLSMMSIAGIGFLMKYVLIPGKEVHVKYGKDVELSLLGMDRHEWGGIHLIIGFVLLGLLILHIILHWKMILALFRKLFSGKRVRIVIALLFIIVCSFLVICPFIIIPEISKSEVQRYEQEGGHNNVKQDYQEGIIEGIENPEIIIQDSSLTIHHHINDSIEVRGSMSLFQVAEKYNVPIDYLKEQLGIPKSTSNEVRLGKLRKQYAFKMSDVERIIDEFHNSHR